MTLIVVTTCPRPGGASYLRETLESLGPGWGDEVIVLNDSERRGSRWNTWRALRLSLTERCSRLLLLQDDVVLEPGTIERMTAMEIPEDVGLVTFHDFGTDFFGKPPPAPGVHRFAAHDGGWGLCGAQCLLMPGEHARYLALQDPDGCPMPGPHGADFAIGWWTARSSRPWKIIVTPSPARHIGERSACHEEDRRAAGVGIPHAGRTLDDLFDQAR